MTPTIRKTVYSDRNIPHYAEEGEEPTHRYRDPADGSWKYMVARSDEDFRRWGASWLDNTRSPQRKARDGSWRTMEF